MIGGERRERLRDVCGVRRRRRAIVTWGSVREWLGSACGSFARRAASVRMPRRGRTATDGRRAAAGRWSPPGTVTRERVCSPRLNRKKPTLQLPDVSAKVRSGREVRVVRPSRRGCADQGDLLQ